MILGLFGLKSGKERRFVRVISGPGLRGVLALDWTGLGIVVVRMVDKMRILWRSMIEN